MQFEEMLNKREAKGKLEGKREGKHLMVIDLIMKKTAKGLSPKVIAEHLEEEETVVQNVCKLFQEHPDASPEEILALLPRE